MQYVVMSLIAVAGFTIGGIGAAGWRDRPLGTTVWWIASALIVLLMPAAFFTGSQTLVLIMLLTLVIGLPLVGIVIDVRGALERGRLKQLAISSGVDQAEADQRYRREPRGWATLFAYYLFAAYMWVGLVMLLVWVTGETSLIDRPAIRIPGSEGLEPYDMPWWIAVTGLYVPAVLAHGGVNEWRRSRRRTGS